MLTCIRAKYFSNIGNVYYKLNKFDEDLMYHKEAFKIIDKELGDNLIDKAESCSNISNLCLS